MTPLVWIFLAPGFEEAEAVVPWDLFLRADYRVSTWGLGGLDVTGSHGISMRATFAWPSEPKVEPDLVYLPGGMPGAKNLAQDRHLAVFLKKFAASGKTLSALCASPAVVLGSLGLLDGKRFTCYPGMEIQVEGGFWTDGDVVEDGNIVTSRGMGTAVAMAFHLISKFSGQAAAEELARRTLWH